MDSWLFSDVGSEFMHMILYVPHNISKHYITFLPNITVKKSQLHPTNLEESDNGFESLKISPSALGGSTYSRTCAAFSSGAPEL